MNRLDLRNHPLTLAILPFENLSAGNDADIFCKSFCIDLITELSRFRQFQIISYDSVREISTDSDTARDIFQNLETDFFVKGSFRYRDGVMRVNVQLINSKTHHLIWADRFIGQSEELMDIQENLLVELVSSLQGQLNFNLLSLIRKKPKTNLRVYECWLYGIEELKKGSLENDLKAREYFRQAIEMDPDYSLGYSGMSLTYFNEWSCQLWDRWELSQNGAFEWAQKAIELDEQNYVAAYVLGRIFLYDGAYETAEHYLRKSLRLNANDPDSLIEIAGCFMYLGYGKEAFKLYEKALRLNPEGGELYFPIGSFILIEQGSYKEALSLAGKAKSFPYVDVPAYFATAWFHLENYDKMKEYWQQFLENYSKIINQGEPATTEEAIRWMSNVNPFRHKSKVEALWEYLTGDEIKLTLSNQTEMKTAISGPGILKRQDDVWEFSYGGTSCKLTKVKGFYDLQTLLSHPRTPIHCAELMGVKIAESGEPVFDQKAKETYQEKLLDLQKDIEFADTNNDFERLSALQEEYEEIIEHLSKSLGLKSRVREVGDPIEKARSAVTWRIRSAISKVEKAHPTLGKHLSNSIQTGTFCSYEPENEMEWVV